MKDNTQIGIKYGNEDAAHDYVVKRTNAEWKRRVAEAPTDLLDPETEKKPEEYVAAHMK